MRELSPISNARMKVLALIDHDRETMRAVLVTAGLLHDECLKHLTASQGCVAVMLDKEAYFPQHLRTIYGCCVGWLMNLHVLNVQNRINAERDRQDELFVEGKIPFNCASRKVNGYRKLRVLVEEVGEVAEAIDFLEQHDCKRRRDHLVTEIIQVAAVTVAWLESLEVKP